MITDALTLGLIEVVEQAALASAIWMGKGDKQNADLAAVEAMRTRLNEMPISGKVVIGEGERDEAPMLFIGEEVGDPKARAQGGSNIPTIDIAVDPCEGTSLVAKGQPGALAVIAIAERGGLLQAPDFYMRKLAAPAAAKGKMSLNLSPTENIRILSQCLDRAIEELVILIQDRPRHKELIQEVRATGARIRLFGEGDVAAAITCAFEGTHCHALLSTGGAPEGVLAAAAMKCIGGHFEGQLVYDPAVVQTGLIGESKEKNRERLLKMGIEKPDAILGIEQLAPGKDVVFAASGITPGEILDGVRLFPGGTRTHSVLMSSRKKSIRFVDSVHMHGQVHNLKLR
jgi:fructose-1,6-bisphosphatase II / sedoheptulose-1,7-bisphosphatase